MVKDGNPMLHSMEEILHLGWLKTVNGMPADNQLVQDFLCD